MRIPSFVHHLPAFLLVVIATGLLGIGSWMLLREPAPPVSRPAAHNGGLVKTLPGPPWRYGGADARFSIVEYADLECPFCRAYFPVLRQWIDAHPNVNLQWHHLPLSIHEPAASNEARLAECAGQAGGQDAFWKAVAWIYDNTRGNGQGLPEGKRYPDQRPALQRCLDSDRPGKIVLAQAADATQVGVSATPTLRVQDHKTGKTLLLHGPVDGDALLSALDFLSAEPAQDITISSSKMPATTGGDMPR